MKLLRLALLALAFLSAPAEAQTVVGPQTCAYPFYTKGVTAAGVLNCSSVGFDQISFSGLLFATDSSNSPLTASAGLSQVIGLNNNSTGFKVGYRVQARNLNDPQCYFYGFITTTTPADQTITVSSDTGVGACTDTSWSIQVTPSFVWPSASTGLSTDSIAIPSVGNLVTITTQANKLFQPGSHIVMESTDDATQFFRGNSEYYVGTSLKIRVTYVSPTASGTWGVWNVIGHDDPTTSPLLSGTSTTPQDPSGAAGTTVTFATTIGLLSSSSNTALWFIYSASDPSFYFYGQGNVAGGSLSVKVFEAAGSGTKTDWVVQLLNFDLGMPSAAIGLGGTGGGLLAYFDHANFNNQFPGVMGNVSVSASMAGGAFNANLVYQPTASTQLALIWGSGGGALTVAGTASVLGTNTGDQTFGGITTSNLSPMTTRGDIITQGASGAQRVALGASGTIVSSDGIDTKPQTASALGLVTTSTAILCANLPPLTGDITSSACATTIGATKVTSAMLNADVFSTAHSWAGQQTFVAPILGTPASGTLTNATGLPAASVVAGALANGMTATTQSAADNSTKLATTAYADAAGATYATQANMEAASSTTVAVSPGRQQYHPLMPKARGYYSLTTSSVTGNISSVSSNVITWSTTHNLATGNIIVPLGGTWPTGASLAFAYYVCANTTTTFTLYLTPAAATTCTTPITLTGSGSGTRTMNKWVIAAIDSSAMAATNPLAFTGGQTSVQTIFSPLTAFSSSSWQPVTAVYNAATNWSLGIPTLTTTTATISIPGGTWDALGTTNFSFTALGDQ